MYTIKKQRRGHLILTLIRNGEKIGLVTATPYDAKITIPEPDFKGTVLTPAEKLEAQMKAKRTMIM